MSNFIDLKKLLPYQRLFTWVVGSGSGGKTFGAKKLSLENFLEKGQEFAYIRRFKKDLHPERFFNSHQIEGFFTENVFTNKGNTLYCDDKICGYCFRLSEAVNLKSDEYPKIYNFIFDEFILEKNGQYYLPREADAFQSLIYSVARKRPIKVWCLSNAVSLANPYFLTFKLEIPKPNKVWYNEFHLVYNFVRDLQQEELSELERFMLTTDYGRMRIGNDFVNDTQDFIEIKGKSNCIFTADYNGVRYGFWFADDRSVIWVSLKHNNSSGQHYAFTTRDHKPNTMLIKEAKKYGIFKWFIKFYNQGFVRYESLEIKSVIREILAKTI